MKPIDRNTLETLIPHKGVMCFWQTVTDWDTQTLTCQTGTHLDSDHPLAENGVLPNSALIEYGAQACALHQTLLAQAHPDGHDTPSRGYIARLKKVRFAAWPLTTSTLSGQVEPLAVQDQSALYQFRLLDDSDRTYCQGQVLVLNPDEHKETTP
ncbi:MAG: hypothetical protein RI556_10950 [Hydrogenovibrio sp.]|uniref:hypothetical protein n=1 Tax=Hydrogenovibrio sp. TaxID=2065821 RepID=UPI00287058EE|nr:hypothetical protein [Hydrogenovibrio sp.]MDR9499683.1 hypothetical protein [Hydrogenovibrio sp.]